MVKYLVRAAVALVIAVLLGSCKDGFSLPSLIPWYTPYVKETISLPDLLTQAYKDKTVYARSLTGPDPSNLSKIVTWIVIGQQRDPDPRMVNILNSSFQQVYSVQSYQLGSFSNYFVDANGNLQLDGIQVNPPTASSGWGYGTSPLVALNNFGGTMVSFNVGGQSYIFQSSFYLSAAAGNTVALNVTSYNSVYTAATSWSQFQATPSTTSPPFNYASLFSATSVSNPLPTITVNSARIDYSNSAAPVVEYRCSISAGSNNSGPVSNFLIRIPESSFSATGPDISGIKAPVVMNAAGAGSSSVSYTDPSVSGITATESGYVTILSSYNNGGSNTQLPLVYNSASGAQKARITVPLSNYPSASGNNSGGSSTSSISQRPLPLDGFDDWIVADGLHACIYRCTAWWQ